MKRIPIQDQYFSRLIPFESIKQRLADGHYLNGRQLALEINRVRKLPWPVREMPLPVWLYRYLIRFLKSDAPPNDGNNFKLRLTKRMSTVEKLAALKLLRDEHGYISGKQLAKLLSGLNELPMPACLSEYLVKFLNGEARRSSEGKPRMSEAAIDFLMGDAELELQRAKKKIVSERAAAKSNRKRRRQNPDLYDSRSPTDLAAAATVELVDGLEMSPEAYLNKRSKWRMEKIAPLHQVPDDGCDFDAKLAEFEKKYQE